MSKLDHRITVNVDAFTKEKLEAQADQNSRSVANEGGVIIKTSFQKNKPARRKGRKQ